MYWSEVRERGWLLEMCRSTVFSREEAPLPRYVYKNPEAHGDNL